MRKESELPDSRKACSSTVDGPCCRTPKPFIPSWQKGNARGVPVKRKKSGFSAKRLRQFSLEHLLPNSIPEPKKLFTIVFFCANDVTRLVSERITGPCKQASPLRRLKTNFLRSVPSAGPEILLCRRKPYQALNCTLGICFQGREVP